MSTNKSKSRIWFYIILTIIGCVLACSSIITNDYLKLLIVMSAMGFGLFGIMRGLSTPSSAEEATSVDK